MEILEPIATEIQGTLYYVRFDFLLQIGSNGRRFDLYSLFMVASVERTLLFNVLRLTNLRTLF